MGELRKAKAKAQAMTRVVTAPRLTQHSIRCAELGAKRRYQLDPAFVQKDEREAATIAREAIASVLREHGHSGVERREGERQMCEQMAYGVEHRVDSKAYRQLRMERLQQAHAKMLSGPNGAWIAEQASIADGRGQRLEELNASYEIQRALEASVSDKHPLLHSVDIPNREAAMGLSSAELLAVIRGLSDAVDTTPALLPSDVSPENIRRTSRHKGSTLEISSSASAPSKIDSRSPPPRQKANVVEIARKPGRKYISAAARAALEMDACEQAERMRARDVAVFRADPKAPALLQADALKKGQVAKWRRDQVSAAEVELLRRVDAVRGDASCQEEATARAARSVLQ